MTVSRIISTLSACDLIDDLKIIEINIEPPVQSIKLRARLKNGILLQITRALETISGGIHIISRRGI